MNRRQQQIIQIIKLDNHAEMYELGKYRNIDGLIPSESSGIIIDAKNKVCFNSKY